MVAKTYQSFPMSGEPFEENKKWYVMVKTTKGDKKVRWYSDAEYKRIYPEATIENTFNARHAFGFRDSGYITLYKGNEEDVRAWAQGQWPPKAWYNTIFGFYTPPHITSEIPPENLQPIRLSWDEVKQDDIHMRSNETVRKYIDSILCPSSKKSAVWETGIWLEKEVTIKDKTTKESHFGKKHTYHMLDAEGNTYVWETGAKDYETSMVVTLKMRVKESKEDYTVVWYCKEI